MSRRTDSKENQVWSNTLKQNQSNEDLNFGISGKVTLDMFITLIFSKTIAELNFWEKVVLDLCKELKNAYCLNPLMPGGKKKVTHT